MRWIALHPTGGKPQNFLRGRGKFIFLGTCFDGIFFGGAQELELCDRKKVFFFGHYTGQKTVSDSFEKLQYMRFSPVATL